MVRSRLANQGEKNKLLKQLKLKASTYQARSSLSAASGNSDRQIVTGRGSSSPSHCRQKNEKELQAQVQNPEPTQPAVDRQNCNKLELDGQDGGLAPAMPYPQTGAEPWSGGEVTENRLLIAP